MKNAKKILICDDDFMTANMISQKLQKNLETENTIAKDGNAALKALDSGEYNLVITVFQLPYKSGYDIIQHLKQDKDEKTPIILLTNGLADDVMMNASLMGADDFLRKPYNSIELLIRSRKLLSA